MIRGAIPNSRPTSGRYPPSYTGHRGSTRRLDEPVIEGQETQIVEPLSEPDGARKVNGVEAGTGRRVDSTL
jgi:hypothetical protein